MALGGREGEGARDGEREGGRRTEMIKSWMGCHGAHSMLDT